MKRFLRFLPWVGGLCIIAFVGVWIWGGVSRKASSILRTGDRVEVFRINSKYEANRRDGICGFEILSKGEDRGAEFGSRLSEIIRRWNVAPSSKKCVFEPGVAFRVWSGDQFVDVLICFKCEDLVANTFGSDCRSEKWAMLDFEKSRQDLLAIVKESLPNDPEIQKLPDHRSTE